MVRGRKPLSQDQVQGVCVICKKNKQMPGPRSKLGFKKYIKFCSSCAKNKYKQTHSKRKYRKHKKSICERCNFIPIHRCQLDVHHKDGNHQNNAIENLETLCANCHRLEHFWG